MYEIMVLNKTRKICLSTKKTSHWLRNTDMNDNLDQALATSGQWPAKHLNVACKHFFRLIKH